MTSRTSSFISSIRARFSIRNWVPGWPLTGLSSGPPDPVIPVSFDGVRHGDRGRLEPVASTTLEVASNGRPIATEVQVRCFPSHGAQQTFLVANARQFLELDTRAVGRKPPQKPALGPPEERIDCAHRAAEQCGAIDVR